jgi:predicted ATP-dependent serine protease
MAKWQCNKCKETKGVINGVCGNCGPTQTIPMDTEAKKEGGFYVAEAENKAKEEAEKKPAEEGVVVE